MEYKLKKQLFGIVIVLMLVPIIGFLVNESLKDNEIELQIIGEEEDIMIESADKIMNATIEMTKTIIDITNGTFLDIKKFKPQNEILLEQIIRNQYEIIENQEEIIILLKGEDKRKHFGVDADIFEKCYQDGSYWFQNDKINECRYKENEN